MVFLTEVVDINRFKNLDHLASYVGLIPGEDSSGDMERTTGIMRSGYDSIANWWDSQGVTLE